MAFMVVDVTMGSLKVAVEKSETDDDWLLVLHRPGGDRFAVYMSAEELESVAKRIWIALGKEGVA